MNGSTTYRHTQKAPLGLMLCIVAAVMFVAAWFVPPPVASLVLVFSGMLTLIFGAAFQSLTVEDEIDQLTVRFGPFPLFRKRVRYDEITSVEPGRTTLLDGWGIHMSLRGGYVWNLWGRDCVVLKLQKGVLRVGTDDVENLAAFIESRLQSEDKE